jgi:hypothetical protein|tara:strand:- start:3137 stop:3577 length:441 start_codon:yes stop_codon:yes gene_type:complete
MSRKSLRASATGKLSSVYEILTMFLHGLGETGAVTMNHDQNLFVQAEMLNLLDGLPAELAGNHPLQFLMHLDHLRQKATQHRLSALRDLSCALETALQPAMQNGGAMTIARSYLEAMRTALDIGEVNPAMTEALMANVALRLGGQP